MDIIDRHFLKLPKKKQAFVFVIVTGFLLVGLIAYTSKLTNLVESLLIILIGILYGDILKLNYRIQNFEKKRKK